MVVSKKKPAEPRHVAMGARIRAGRHAMKPKSKQAGAADLSKLEAFAVAVGLTVSHVAKIERGLVMPHDRKLARISNALGLVQHWVCTGKGRKFLREGESNPVEGC